MKYTKLHHVEGAVKAVDLTLTDEDRNPAHIVENIDIFDFALSEEEMQEICALNMRRRFENW